MPKSKHRKNHKKKLAARKERIKNEKRRYEKMQREFINQLIEKEREKGMYDNMPEVPNTDGATVSTPSTDSNGDDPIIEGPSI